MHQTLAHFAFTQTGAKPLQALGGTDRYHQTSMIERDDLLFDREVFLAPEAFAADEVTAHSFSFISNSEGLDEDKKKDIR
jgi:hypothetical protein